MALPLTNIRAAYNLDDSTGNLVDSTGNGYTLTNTGTVTFSTGLIGEAALFGTSNLTKILSLASSAAGIALSSDWTVAFFWKADTAANGLSVMEVTWGATGASNSNLTIFGRDQANGRWIIFNSGFTSSQTTEGISNGTWYHMMVTRSGSTLTFYVNNTSKGSVAVGSATNRTLRIGTGYSNDAGWKLSGDVDMWYVWDKALDSTERSDVYNGGTGVQYPATSSFTPTPLIHMMQIAGGNM